MHNVEGGHCKNAVFWSVSLAKLSWLEEHGPHEARRALGLLTRLVSSLPSTSAHSNLPPATFPAGAAATAKKVKSSSKGEKKVQLTEAGAGLTCKDWVSALFSLLVIFTIDVACVVVPAPVRATILETLRAVWTVHDMGTRLCLSKDDLVALDGCVNR